MRPLPVIAVPSVLALLSALLLLAPHASAHRSRPVPMTAAAASDLITSLPGIDISTLGFDQYAGYIEVAPGRFNFYWYVESQRDPANDPVALWTNGGPGCSGLIGFLTEQGPFRPNSDGKTLSTNEFAWNTIANMMFIESPAGVGFSYSKNAGDYDNVNDTRTAQDNYMAILGFLARYPHLNRSDFYITSESYGGHYLPTLARTIVAGNKAGQNPKINFKGFAVGNPYTDPISNSIYGSYPTFWGHSLISKPTWDAINQHCIVAPDKQCDQWCSVADGQIGNLDPYGLDFPVCLSTQHQRYRMLEAIHHNRPERLRSTLGPYDPCVGDYETTYLNLIEVRKAIHANVDLPYPWASCSNVLNYNYSELDVYMEPIYLELINDPTISLNILVYSGDDDSVCATLGSQYWLYNLLPVVKDWKAWTAKDGQVGGYLVKFSGLNFVTIHGAGHEVPMYKPELGLELWERYLNGGW